MLRVGSLFAGVGGFDLAAEAAGMEVVWQSEVDPYSSKVLEARWPQVPNHGDIHQIGDDDDDRRVRPAGVDVLVGGFPCQDYSVAGLRGGLAGDRGALWWEFLRLIGSLSPTWVVGENVPGLLSSRDGADFETIVWSLTERGYGVAWAVLDAQYFGVPQRRRRVFIVGHSGGIPRPEVLALAEGLFGHPVPSRQAGQAITGSLAARTRGGGGLGTDFEAGGGGLVAETAPTLVAGYGREYNNEDQVLAHAVPTKRHDDPTIDTLVSFRPMAGSSRSIDAYEDTSAPLTTQLPAVAFDWQAGGTSWTEPALDQSPTIQVGQVPAVRSIGESTNGVYETDEAPTLITAGGTPGRGYSAVRIEDEVSSVVRRLTPLECERLQGFPDDWTKIEGNADTQRYRQMGNAVAVPVVTWLMRQIARADEADRCQHGATSRRCWQLDCDGGRG